MIEDDEEIKRVRAEIALNPVLRARNTLNKLSGQEHDTFALAIELKKQIDAVASGDLRNAEAILFSQTHVLDQLFHNLISNAVSSESLAAMEMCLRLAYKAQNQCRMTLDTLNNIKNPPSIKAEQVNISGGHQQINNGAASENQKQPTELKILNHGKALDNGRTGETIGSDPTMAALEAINRRKNKER